MIPQALVIALIVSIVGHYLQRKSWANNKREEIRQKEFDYCMDLISSMSSLFECRLHETEKYLSFINGKDKESKPDNDIDASTINSYYSSISAWMSSFYSNKLKIHQYFGSTKAAEFEENVHASLYELSSIIERTKKYGKENLSKPHLLEHSGAEAKIRNARIDYYKYITSLTTMMNNEDIGRTKRYKSVNMENIEYLSNTYLIQRAFGIKP